MNLLKYFISPIIFIAALNNNLGQTPPMGWNSWNYFGCDINENMIKITADQLVSTGLAAKGYVYVNIDDCWQLFRDANGVIQPDPSRFPSGMKDLANYVHSLGLKFGLYSDAGYATCQRRPGSLNYEEIDAKTYAEWGVDYLKYDNCNHDGTSAKIRYSKMRDALLKTGRDIYFSMCEWGLEKPHLWASSVANSWRTTEDISDNFDVMLYILDRQFGLEKYSRRGAWNDADMLEVGNGGMTYDEYLSHFVLWSLLKSPLMIGCDMSKVTKETLEILGNENIIAINQDPLGKQGYRILREIRKSGIVEIYRGDVIDGIVIVLFNRSNDVEQIEIDFSKIDFKGGNATNLITNENLGYLEKSYSSNVRPHSVIVIKLFNDGNTLTDSNKPNSDEL